MKELIVKEEKELLEFLKENVEGSKNNIKSLLTKKKVTVNGKIISAYDFKLKKNDKVLIGNNIIETNNLSNIKIVYEDNDYIVVNKPSGLLTISTENEKEKTLYNIISSYVKEKNKKNRIFIVHRLDKDTSGLIVFAKNEKYKEFFQSNWNNFTRKYMAVVKGITKESEELRNYLKETKTFLTYVAKEGNLAITKYKKVKNNNENSLLDIEIKTGRKNQIRVQLANINHPIIGDYKYGDQKQDRLMLNAYYLELYDINNKKKIFKIENPKIFNYYLK